MSSPCRNKFTISRGLAAGFAAVSLALFVGAAIAAGDIPANESGPSFTPDTTLFPGGGSMPPEGPRGKKYDGNATEIAQGARLFDWYNCSGCHFHGAGGIGPSLMDQNWIYGGRIDQIYETIAYGRPNGMPTWRGKIPPEQIWQIAAYVRSLSAPSTAKGGPGETEPTPPPAPVAEHSAAATPPPPPTSASPPQPAVPSSETRQAPPAEHPTDSPPSPPVKTNETP
jgi:cytochrome c oxidase cbb3-type subunit III